VPQVIALKDVPSTEAAIIYTLEPVLGAAFAYMLLGERWGPAGWVGAGLIVSSSLAAQVCSAALCARVRKPPSFWPVALCAPPGLRLQAPAPGLLGGLGSGRPCSKAVAEAEGSVCPRAVRRMREPRMCTDAGRQTPHAGAAHVLATPGVVAGAPGLCLSIRVARPDNALALVWRRRSLALRPTRSRRHIQTRIDAMRALCHRRRSLFVCLSLARRPTRSRRCIQTRTDAMGVRSAAPCVAC
jgi:EamA-like transporter family